MSDTEEGVRTKSAKRLVRASIWRAKSRGHSPVLVCKAGFMELYACKNKGCNLTFDCWDSPEGCNGPMPRAKCRCVDVGSRRVLTAIADLARSLKNILKVYYSALAKWVRKEGW